MSLQAARLEDLKSGWARGDCVLQSSRCDRYGYYGRIHIMAIARDAERANAFTKLSSYEATLQDPRSSYLADPRSGHLADAPGQADA